MKIPTNIASIGVFGLAASVDIETTVFGSSTEAIETLGYAEAGDGGGGVFIRSADEPERGMYFQSEDGAYWLYTPDSIGYNVLSFGAIPATAPFTFENAVSNAVAVNKALQAQDTTNVDSFTVYIPDVVIPVSGTGDRILEIQNGTALRGGGTLEGTIFIVDPASTALAIIEDSSSAAKVEIYDISFFGNNNAALEAGVRLGVRDVQWGAYGSASNIMVRDIPNGCAYDLNANIITAGKLYSIATRDGLIHRTGGIGLSVDAFTPIGFSGIGLQMQIGDVCQFYEPEGMESDDAVSIFFDRGGSCLSMLNAIGRDRIQKRPILLSNDVSTWILGPTTKIMTGAETDVDRARYGDVDDPYAEGIATAVGLRTITLAGANWADDSLAGGAVWITSGTGSANGGTWQEIESNTRDTVTIVGSSWQDNATYVPPIVGSGFAVDPFVKRANGDPFGQNDGGSGSSLSTNKMIVAGQNSTRTLKVFRTIRHGQSAGVFDWSGTFKGGGNLDFGTVTAGETKDLTFALAGAAVGIMLAPTIPTLPAGILCHMSCSGANTVTVRLGNITAADVVVGVGLYQAAAFNYD